MAIFRFKVNGRIKESQRTYYKTIEKQLYLLYESLSSNKQKLYRDLQLQPIYSNSVKSKLAKDSRPGSRI